MTNCSQIPPLVMPPPLLFLPSPTLTHLALLPYCPVALSPCCLAQPCLTSPHCIALLPCRTSSPRHLIVPHRLTTSYFWFVPPMAMLPRNTVIPNKSLIAHHPVLLHHTHHSPMVGAMSLLGRYQTLNSEVL